MANQTVASGSAVNYDSAAISGLLNGETITINGGSVTVDADVRWNQQAAVFGAVTLSSTLGGSFLIDGTKVWEVPFSSATGNVPTQNALGSNGVTGGTSGATGELTRVWATGSLSPATAGTAMPATGYIKLRSRTGTFVAGETITLPGGATVTASGEGKRSWIHVVGRELTTLTVPRLGVARITGDWHEIGTTNGADDQLVQFPVADECPAVQVETAAGSGVYEWWLNAGGKWANIISTASNPNVSGQNLTRDLDFDPAPINPSDPYGYFTTGIRLRETTANGTHVAGYDSITSSAVETGNYTVRFYLKKDGRRFGFVQVVDGTASYGAIIDFDTAGAVVANPTVGTPTGTSTTVTAGSGTWAGWFLVSLTFDHALANATQVFVGTSNSATPTLVSGRPSFVGDTTQGIFVSEAQVVAPNSFEFVNSVDARGKYFFSNPTTGQLRFARRTGYSAGLKPPAGCRIRVPNVILSSAAAVDYSRNTQNVLPLSRYLFTTTAAGAVDISHAVCNWTATATNAFSYSVQNSAAWFLSATNIAGATTINNCGVGLSRDITATPIALASCFVGGAVTDVFAARSTAAASAVSANTCTGFTLTRVRVDVFATQGRPTVRASAGASAIELTNCTSTAVNDCAVLGARLIATTSVGTSILNLRYADRLVGTTDTVNGATAIQLTTSTNNTYIEGFDSFAGLANVHPQGSIVDIRINCAGLEVRNIGTATSPYNCGTVAAAACGNLVVFGGTAQNISLRRIYAQNVRLAALSTLNTTQGVSLSNVWSDANDVQRIACVGQTSRGCRWSNNGTVENAVYGTHWEDAYTGTTSGRITIYGNEPLASTADQCSATFGANAGFTSAGAIAMPNLTDEVTWTMPYYALGHTGIARYTYGASAAETWSMTGTNQQNFDFEYQIDKGSGFGPAKPLLEIGRRQAGGTVGSNTLVIYGTEWAAMRTKPAVGWLVQGTAANVPAGTTITGIAVATHTTLTLSNNVAVAWGTDGLTYFWRDIADEVVTATTGYKLRVRCRVNTASSTNDFRYLRIPFDTTASDQQIEYPLPGSLVTVNNLVPNSRVKVSRADTGAFLAQGSNGAGTSLTLDLPYTGAVVVEARNASATPAYRPWVTQASVSLSSPITVFALQESD